jgi:hypothetical protein
VVVELSVSLAGCRMRLDMYAGYRRYALGTYEHETSALPQSTFIDSCVVKGIDGTAIHEA